MHRVPKKRKSYFTVYDIKTLLGRWCCRIGCPAVLSAYNSLCFHLINEDNLGCPGCPLLLGQRNARIEQIAIALLALPPVFIISVYRVYELTIVYS